MRTFEHSVAIRRRVWLRTAFAGPTGSGKSLSAQLLNLGFASVDPGPVWLINTEGANGLLYAPKPGQKATPPTTFNFEHLRFDPPHRTPDYLAAVRYAVENGARHIIIDGGHFEHEAYLAYHEAEVTRLVGRNDTYERRNKMAMTGWIKPSAERHAALLALRLVEANITWCFQGKSKIHMKKKGEMKDDENETTVDMGWSPIAGAEVVAEIPIRFLLPPGADGVPSLKPDLPGEKLFSRVPIELRQPGFLTLGRAIDVDLGKKLQEWAMESTAPVSAQTAPDTSAILAEIKSLLATLPTQEAKKAAVAAAFNLPWAKVQTLDILALSDGLQKLRSAVSPAVVPVGDHRDRVRAAASAKGITDQQLSSMVSGSLDDMPAEAEDEVMAAIENYQSREPGID